MLLAACVSGGVKDSGRRPEGSAPCRGRRIRGRVLLARRSRFPATRVGGADVEYRGSIMAYLRTILTDNHPTLRKIAKKYKPSEITDPLTQQLIDDMFATMYAAPGIGLAAPQ